jgi:hypothetical protein
MTHNGATQTITGYVDGVSGGTLSNHDAGSTFNGEVWVGKHGGTTGQAATGILLDDIRLYEKVITQDEINFIYNTGTGTESSLTGQVNPTTAVYNGVNTYGELKSGGEDSFWAFNNNRADSVGSNPLVVQAGAGSTFVTGKLNQAHHFASSADIIGIGSYSGFTTGNADRSLACWIKVDSLPVAALEYFFSMGVNVATQAWMAGLQESGGNYFINSLLHGDDVASSAIALTTGWHHVAIVYTAADKTSTFYFDGSLVNAVAHSGNSHLQPGQIRMNCHINGLGGRAQALDDFRLYDSAILAGDVTTIYNGGAGTEASSGIGFASQVENALPTITGTVTDTQMVINGTIDGLTYELEDAGFNVDTGLAFNTKNPLVNLTGNPTIMRIKYTGTSSEVKTWALKLFKS